MENKENSISLNEEEIIVEFLSDIIILNNNDEKKDINIEQGQREKEIEVEYISYIQILVKPSEKEKEVKTNNNEINNINNKEEIIGNCIEKKDKKENIIETEINNNDNIIQNTKNESNLTNNNSYNNIANKNLNNFYNSNNISNNNSNANNNNFDNKINYNISNNLGSNYNNKFNNNINDINNNYTCNNGNIDDHHKKKSSNNYYINNNTNNLENNSNKNFSTNTISNNLEKNNCNNMNSINSINNININNNNYNNCNQIINNNNNYTNNNIISNNNNINNNYSNSNNINNCNNNTFISPYLFTLVGLNNVGATCFMNATLQCLIHISELSLYFLNEYPKDFQILNAKNNNSETKGEMAQEYHKIIKGVYLIHLQNKNNNNYYYGAFAPRDFKRTLGYYNSQFSQYEANDSKDLILYLLQTFHEELNYMGDNPFPTYLIQPNQLNRPETFNYFMNVYNFQNLSIISRLFYGTYENTTKCFLCKNIFYAYQKFEFISFSTYKYKDKLFDIYDGFSDNESAQYLTGNNQYFCNICQKFSDAEIYCKIIQPPSKLLINIDYGKDKKYQVSKLKFDEIIDITKYINFDFGTKIKYQISGICTHLGSSGNSGHYIAYCRHNQTGKWYNFNDSSCRECNKSEIYNGSPYLLIYEKIEF